MRSTTTALIAVLVVAALGAVTADAATQHTIGLRTTKLGKIVVDSKGRTLYLFMKDKNGRSACSGQCAKFWPPDVVSGKPTAGTGLSSSKLGTTDRGRGVKQVTYNGHPLYIFAGDKGKPGATAGQGSTAFGAEWYVVGANGNQIAKKGS